MSKVPCASIVGSLMYVMVCTHLDIAHVISIVSHFLSNRSKEHWNAIKLIMRYLRGTFYLKLCYRSEKPILVGYKDLDMASGVVSWKLRLLAQVE